MQESMTTAQAMAIVRKACAAFNGVLADHEKIQAALQVIETSLPQRQRRRIKQTQ